MAYEKQTWANGDIITAEKLNHMEDGIYANGVLVVGTTVSGNTITLDKTWLDIHEALLTGGAIIATETTKFIVVGCQMSAGRYRVMTAPGDVFTATAEDGYPVHEMS